MTSIQVSVCEAQAHAIRTGKLTVGMVGVSVSFSFDEAWDGLEKYAVFRSGNVTRDRSLMLSNETTVPHEVLHKAEEKLYIGVEGRGEDGTLVIPTTWADAGVVLSGANATGAQGEDPTPNAYDDIMAAIQSGILRGPEGLKGDKPVKGVDYYTPEEQAQLVETVLNAADASVGTGPAVVCEAAGELIGVADASDWPLKGLHIYGKTNYSETPTPDAPIDLVSVGDGGEIAATVAGKNLFDFQKGVSVITYTTAEGDVAEKYGYDIRLPAGTYSLKAHGTNKNSYIYGVVTDSDGNTKQGCALITAASYTPRTVTIADGDIVKIFNGVSISSATEAGSNAVFARFDIQIEAGSAHTEYEPYKGQTITIPTPNGLPGIPVASGGNYTDSNGQQWGCDEIDFARGVYVKRVDRMVFDGSEDEAWEGLYADNGNLCGYRIKVDGIAAADASSVSSCLCNRYPTKSADTLAAGMDGICVQAINGECYVKVYAAEYYNVGGIDWYTDLGEHPLVCLFPKTIPEETTLSAEELVAYAAVHTNKPNTTVYTDSNAGIKLDYIADTKTYIDNKFAQLSANSSEV